MRIITYSTKINRENNLTELVKEKAYNYKTENKHLDCAEKIASMICDLFELHTAAEEYVYLLSLDTKCRILGIFEVGHGTVNACLLHTRKIMIRNLLCGAGTFIVVHNHPSGEVSVSKEDISTTKRLFEAGRLIGIELLDHIIIGRKWWQLRICLLQHEGAGAFNNCIKVINRELTVKVKNKRLDFSSLLLYNHLRKVIGCVIRLPSVI